MIIRDDHKTNNSLRTDYKTIILDLFIFAILCIGKFNPFSLPFSNTTIMLLFACYSLWARGLAWKNVGLKNPTSWMRVISVSLLAAILIVTLFIWMILPFATWLTGKAIDFSVFESLRGNFSLLLQNIALVWIFAAFAEEMIFRGYLMNRLVDLIGSTTVGYIIALILSSVIFGAAHTYQGTTGMINAGLIGFLFGSLYLLSKRNLWAVIICHGLVDTMFMILVYLNLEGNLFN